MGTIDEKCYLYGSCKCQTAGCVVLPNEGCPVYRYFKDLIVKDYEARLKADMVAILTELQLEIEEHIENERYPSAYMEGHDDGCKECKDLIQRKINELKAESEG